MTTTDSDTFTPDFDPVPAPAAPRSWPRTMPDDFEQLAGPPPDLTEAQAKLDAWKAETLATAGDRPAPTPWADRLPTLEELGAGAWRPEHGELDGVYGTLREAPDDDHVRLYRLSSTMSCRRMRVLAGHGWPEDDDREAKLGGYFTRGKVLEPYVVARVLLELDDVVAWAVSEPETADALRDRRDLPPMAQPEGFDLRTPFGPGHPDLVTLHADGHVTVWDVKTTTDDGFQERWAWQVRAYMRWLTPQAVYDLFAGTVEPPDWSGANDWEPTPRRLVRGMVVRLHPSNFARIAFLPVDLFPHHRVAIDREELKVLELVQRRDMKWRDLPKRVCAVPSDGEGRLCSMVTACFRSWRPTEEEATDPEVVALAKRLAALNDHHARAKANADRYDRARKRAQADLERVVPPSEGKVRRTVKAGGVVMHRTVSTSERVSVADAAKAGVITPYLRRKLAPFTKASTSTRWTVKREE